jgi:hypothetical protein
MPPLPLFAWIILSTVAALLVGAALLHLVPRLGAAGQKISEHLCRAPVLDLLITYFTILPMIVGAILDGWRGLAGGIAGQIIAMLIWQTLHELANPQARKGPRIVKTINRNVGAWRNYSAVWITAIAVPGFWIVRVCQWIVYPPITWLVRLPRYNHAEWVNVSRQKFCGLVGHDLIWCLYCDWMTGIWSLGSEMLRNVESFWCPIRFASDKKCANCAVDFPDINGGWVPANGTMAQVTQTWERQYAMPPGNERGAYPWFGHPVRGGGGRAQLTIEGKQASRKSVDDVPEAIGTA